jgi:hypothetical protein
LPSHGRKRSTADASQQTAWDSSERCYLGRTHAQVNGSFEVLKGPPADTKASISAALCSKTKAEGAAAIVIGSASRGGLQEALLGSIAANLAHNCDVPVVVLHKPTASDSAAAGKVAGKGGQHAAGDVTWLLRASTQEILGETAAEQLEPPAGQQQQVRAGNSFACCTAFGSRVVGVGRCSHTASAAFATARVCRQLIQMQAPDYWGRADLFAAC